MSSRPLLLLTFALLAACSRTQNVSQQEPLSVDVAEVRPSVSAASMSTPFAAIIGYDREITISPRVSGVIMEMPVAIGGRLGRGALIAAIADAPYRAALERAGAEYARLTRAASRNQALLEAGAIAPADLQDNAGAATAARAAQNAATYDLASTRLRMPFDGVILGKTADVGTTIGPGQPIVTVADINSPLVARAQIPPALAARLRPGMAAQVLVAGSDAPMGAYVLRKGAIANSRTATVEIDLRLDHRDDMANGLVSGTVASVRLSGGITPVVVEAQHIPVEALVDSRDGKGHVYVIDQRSGTARLTLITVLGLDDDDVRIAGLAPGTRVITAGAGFVADGQRVSVLAR